MNEQDRKPPGPRERQGPGALPDRQGESRSGPRQADLEADELLSDRNDPLQRAYSRRKVERERR